MKINQNIILGFFLLFSFPLWANCPDNKKATALKEKNGDIILAEINKQGEFEWCIQPSVRPTQSIRNVKQVGLVLTTRNNLVLTIENKIWRGESWFGLPYQYRIVGRRITLPWFRRKLIQSSQSSPYQIKLINKGCHSHGHGSYQNCHLEMTTQAIEQSDTDSNREPETQQPIEEAPEEDITPDQPIIDDSIEPIEDTHPYPLTEREPEITVIQQNTDLSSVSDKEPKDTIFEETSTPEEEFNWLLLLFLIPIILLILFGLKYLLNKVSKTTDERIEPLLNRKVKEDEDDSYLPIDEDEPEIKL